MKNKTINIILIVVLILLGIIVLFLLLKSKKGSVPGLSGNGFPLKKGSTGQNVVVLQNYLNDRLSLMDIGDKIVSNNIKYIKAPERLNVDGIFGDKTLQAVYNEFNRYDVTAEIFKNKIQKFYNTPTNPI